jgi:hypothetical protein
MVGQAFAGVNAELRLGASRLSWTEAGGEFIGVDLLACIAPEKRIG